MKQAHGTRRPDCNPAARRAQEIHHESQLRSLTTSSDRRSPSCPTDTVCHSTTDNKRCTRAHYRGPTCIQRLTSSHFEYYSNNITSVKLTENRLHFTLQVILVTFFPTDYIHLQQHLQQNKIYEKTFGCYMANKKQI